MSGADFADAFRSAIARSYGGDKFAAELAELTKAVGGQSPAKGDHVLLTGTAAGLRVQIVGKADAAIKNPAFAKAVWDIYLGAKPISDDLKAGLVSRVGR